MFRRSKITDTNSDQVKYCLGQVLLGLVGRHKVGISHSQKYGNDPRVSTAFRACWLSESMLCPGAADNLSLRLGSGLMVLQGETRI